jgi:hypothetical protein
VPDDKYPDLAQELEELRQLWAKVGDRSNLEGSAELEDILRVQDRIRQKWEDHYQKQGLNVRGRSKTEARLREMYAEASEEDKGNVAHFLFQWKSKRGLRVADDWMNEDPPYSAYDSILVRYSLCDGMQTVDRFLSQLDREELDDHRRNLALERFSDLIDYRQRHPRYHECLAVIARHLTHAYAEVRATAACRLGLMRAAAYREQLSALLQDKTKCCYGYVSAVARNAVRMIDGDDDVDIYDASEP